MESGERAMIKMIEGGVTAPKGFMAAGAAAGIRKKGRPDVAVVYSTVPAAAAAVCAMGLAGEIGFRHMKPEDGNSTYRNRIIDAIYHMDQETLDQGANYEVR